MRTAIPRRRSDPAGLEVPSRYCRPVTGNPTDLELNPPSMTGLSGEYHALAEQLATPDTTAPAAWPPSLSAVNSVDSLRRFVTHHATEILSAQEWPVILQAWRLAREGKSRELIVLDGDWGRRVGQADFAGASFRVGRRQLSKLRGLRHERVIQKYLAAIEAGDARGWHPSVYGVVLAVYNLPLRQGLMNFGVQTLTSLVNAAEKAHRLPARECQELLDTTHALLPARLPALDPIAVVPSLHR